ncbi:MAG: spore maturation protein [Ruminococcus sp.]|jgi:spore maturation protein B|nr:spore maturation protein [Ruminococcus sp.]
MNYTDFLIPGVIALIVAIGFIKKIDVFGEFTDGAAEALKSGVSVLPALVALMTAIGMFRASGALGALTAFLSPAATAVGFPPEVLPLALIRPISGSGAIAVFDSILTEVSPDSFAGRVASVIMGASETTFYTIAVYFGATKIKKPRRALGASLTADFTAFVVSAVAVSVFFNL